MATFRRAHQDKLEQCPYNPYHKVASRRLTLHIAECAKKYPDWVECPFNSLHRMPKTHLEQHIVKCRDNRRVIRETYERQKFLAEKESTSGQEPSVQALPAPPIPRMDDEDDWDNPDNKTNRPICFRALSAPETLDVEEIVARTPLGKQVDPLIRQRLTPAQRKQLDQLLIRKQKEQREDRRQSQESSQNSSRLDTNFTRSSAVSISSEPNPSSEPSLSYYAPSNNLSLLSNGEPETYSSSRHTSSDESGPPFNVGAIGPSDLSLTSISASQSPYYYYRNNSVDSNQSANNSLFQSDRTNDKTFVGIGRGSGRLSLSSDSVQRIAPHLIRTNFNSPRTSSRSSHPSLNEAYDFEDASSIIQSHASTSSIQNEPDRSIFITKDTRPLPTNLDQVKTEPQDDAQDDPRYKSHSSIPLLETNAEPSEDASCLSPSRGKKRDRSPSSEETQRRDKIPFLDS